MLKYDFEESVGYWITLTSHFYQQKLNAELAPYGITFRQFQVLSWLAFAGALSPAELAERLMIEPPTLAGLLDRMERDGWVERRPSQLDRRRKLVVLRPAAEPVWRKVVHVLKQMRQQATQGMTPDEVQTLMRLLKRVQLNLGVDLSSPSLPRSRAPASTSPLVGEPL